MEKTKVKLKVMEAVQDDVNKGIVKIDSGYMKQVDVMPGDIVEIKGERITAAIVDRAYPGDIGLNIIRMDGNIRRNARTSIGEMVMVTKADVKPAKKVVVAPANKGVLIKASSQLFLEGLLGKALVKGDIVSLGRARKKSFPGHDPNDIFSMMESQFASFGLGAIKFIVVDTQPRKEIVMVMPDTEIEYSPHAVELREEEGLRLGINYEDIGGLGEEIKKVREMIELPLKHPEIFEKLGIEAPKGVLLHGPPGTGKTLLAKAVASETNSHFILINGPEVISKFYGESEANLRKKFEEAEQNAPAIIFFDEIDAIATKREETKGDVEKRVVAQLLGLMDGLKSRGKVIVIAATNMPNLLDPALRRPGRFDREIEIGVPDKEGRLEILKIHTRNMPLKGMLYGDIVQKELMSTLSISLELRIKEVSGKEGEINEIKRDISIIKNDVDLRNKDLKSLKEKVDQLEERRKKADQDLLYRIVESISGLSKSIKNINDDIRKNEQELENLNSKMRAFLNLIEEKKSEIKGIQDIIKELESSKRKLNDMIDKIITLDIVAKKNSLNDARRKIIDNKKLDLYDQLEQLNILSSVKEKAKMNREAISRDLYDIARVTHGFVGADLNSLAKEAAMIVLRNEILPEIKKIGLQEEEPLPKNVLEKAVVTKSDFIEALKVVRPSAMREVLVETPDVLWDDVGGLDDVKEKLKEAVEWPLKKPELFKRMGIRPPRGILLYGPPGTGKTLLAKAVAKESEANFILVNGPSLLSKWVGESEKAVREIFRKARQTAPTILFFDEIDALVPRRSTSDTGEGMVSQRVVNQMLTEMDGLETLNDVLIIGATNRPDLVDPALLRSGRFDRVILTPVPNKQGRKKILEIHLQKMPLSSDVDVDDLAGRMEGYVGADIEGVTREAAMIALREDTRAKEVAMRHFERALEAVHPSVDEEIVEVYKQLETYFSSARAKQIKEEKVAYVG